MECGCAVAARGVRQGCREEVCCAKTLGYALSGREPTQIGRASEKAVAAPAFSGEPGAGAVRIFPLAKRSGW